MDGVQTGVLWPYIKQLGVYHCPLDIEQGLWVGTNWLTSYTANGAECGYPPQPSNVGVVLLAGTPGLKITQFPHNANCVLYWEAFEGSYEGESLNSGGNFKDGASSPNQELMTDRHYKGGNVAYLDGHVDWMDQQTWFAYVQVTQYSNGVYYNGPNDLWCCPLYQYGGPGVMGTGGNSAVGW